jgi:hypothetical protein
MRPKNVRRPLCSPIRQRTPGEVDGLVSLNSAIDDSGEPDNFS